MKLIALATAATLLAAATADTRTLTAELNQDGISGTVTFTQVEGATSADIAVDITGFTDEQLPVSYHVHTMPIKSGCGADSTGGHHNPLGVDNVGCSTSAQDLCEQGDLSGKHGALTTLTVDATYTDTNIELFGENSIVGRSVVFHDNTGARIACADIGFAGPTKEVVATFDMGGIAGTITLAQDSTDEASETTVLVDFSTVPGTTPHKYHVHALPTDIADPEDCSLVGGHYNPLSLDLDSPTYGDGDDATFEVGDLSGKHGTLDLSAATRVLYMDTNLPLSGTNGVAGRSIVVHDVDGSRLACANINHAVDEDKEVDDDDDDDAAGIGRKWLIVIVAFGLVLLFIVVFCAFKYSDRSVKDVALCGTWEENAKLKERPPSLDVEDMEGIEVVYSVPSPIHSPASMA